jgi:small acid-soluble spore protein E (minor gamma-type SASP)
MFNRNNQPQEAQTNAQKVRQQNQQSQQGAGGYQSEFASETNAQQVRQQNQQSMAKKNQRPQA